MYLNFSITHRKRIESHEYQYQKPYVILVGIMQSRRGVGLNRQLYLRRERVSGRGLPNLGVVVDIRPLAQRLAEGTIKGALIIERNVLEWRFDPRSKDGRMELADRYDLRIIVFCQEGYTSSLAAKALQDVGQLNATDVTGGFKAWKEAGLPIE